MMLLFKLGYRNLWRNRRRTLLTMTAMGMATALLILTLGIYDGMLWDMIEGSTELYHGHVKITAKDYLEQHKLDMTIPEKGWYDNIAAEQQVKGIAGRVKGFALLSFGEGDSSHTQPAELFGIDLEEERTVSRLHECVTEGTFLIDSSNHDIVLGKGLAKLLEAEIGGEIVAMGQGADRSIAADIFYVAGIVDTGDNIRDATFAIVGRKTLQEMLVLEGKIHELSISLKHSIKAEEWAERMQSEFPDMDVTPWNEFLPAVGQILEIWATIKFIFAIFFYFAVILVTMNTMYMALIERMREFGIMSAIGLKLRRLSLLILIEGFFISAISGIVGGLVGIGASFILSVYPIDLSAYMTQFSYGESTIQPQIRSYPALDNMLVPIIMIIILGVLIAILPALKLRKLRPVEVLREV